MTDVDDGPADDNPTHKAVDIVIDHIANGRVIPQKRQDLRKALDKADAPLAGRAGQDHALGRAIRG